MSNYISRYFIIFYHTISCYIILPAQLSISIIFNPNVWCLKKQRKTALFSRHVRLNSRPWHRSKEAQGLQRSAAAGADGGVESDATGMDGQDLGQMGRPWGIRLGLRKMGIRLGILLRYQPKKMGIIIYFFFSWGLLGIIGSY